MKIITSHELFKNQNHEFFKTAALESLQNVEDIIEDIKKNGDKSIIHYSKTFNDGDFSSGEDFIVSKEEIKKAYEMTDDKTINALEKCIENVRDFAQEQLSCLKNLDMKKTILFSDTGLFRLKECFVMYPAAITRCLHLPL